MPNVPMWFRKLCEASEQYKTTGVKMTIEDKTKKGGMQYKL